MDADEWAIYYYLKRQRGQFVSVRDVGRGAGSRRRSHGLPDWALPVLGRMVERGILEADPAGQYRIKPRPRKAGEKCVSPQLASILKASGKAFTGLILEDDDAYYDSL
jgi:hypothetical protein